MSRVRTQGAQLAVGVRRGSRTAPGRAKGLEENGAGPSGGGGGERGIFKHRGQGQARWAFRAWGTGGDGIYRAQRPKQDSCLTNSFIVPLTMLPVFITSNQIPLHIHAVFCQLHVHCIHIWREA